MCWECFGVSIPKNPGIPWEHEVEASAASYALSRAMQMGSQPVKVEATPEGIRINFDALIC